MNPFQSATLVLQQAIKGEGPLSVREAEALEQLAFDAQTNAEWAKLGLDRPAFLRKCAERSA